MKTKRIKRFLALLLLLLVCGGFAAAQSTSTSNDNDFGLNSKVGILIDFLTSPWIKGIACIFLIVSCITLITQGRQEPELFKRFLPWIIGAILYMAAGTITSTFITTDSSAIKTDLGLN
jgi:type IV secretory pathway VirB2 component (pilin)